MNHEDTETQRAIPDTIRWHFSVPLCLCGENGSVSSPDLPPAPKATSCRRMSTVTDVEATLEKFTPEQLKDVADWLITAPHGPVFPKRRLARPPGVADLSR